MILKTEGIVLKTFDFRETSRIATFFTKDYGKVSGILKGIRKEPRKFSSSLERFSINDIVYYQYRNSDLHLVSQCDLKEFFLPIRQDLKKSLATHYILELVNMIMPVEEKNREIYRLIRDSLTTLSAGTQIDAIVHFFQIKILLLSGFKPHLDTCLKCHKKINGRSRFSLKDGGLVCNQCPLTDTAVHYISPGTVASIIHVENSDWPSCLRLKLTKITQKELKYILNNFLMFHLGRKIKSAKYI